MKAEKHYSLKHADKVLGIIRRLIKQIPSERDMVVQCWANGREQGYYLVARNGKSDMGAVFAQQRNGDSILVIWGEVPCFDISTNTPNDAIWKDNKKCFYNDLDAAQFIVEKLLGI